jgi:outer membrane protein TolC
MKIKNLILILPCVLYANTIDFQTALEKTIQNNKELKAKKLDINKASLSLEEAQGYDYGKLIFNENITNTNHAGHVFGMKTASREASFDDFGFKYFLDNMGSATTQQLLDHQPDKLNNPESRTNFETKISYELPLFTGFKLENGKKMAKLQTLASKVKFSYDEKLLGLEVLKAYNGAVTAKEFIKATKKAKESTSSFVNLANELFNEGLVTDIDVKQASVYDLNVDAKLIEAQNRYELAISYLKFLTEDGSISDVKEFENINFHIDNLSFLQKDALVSREDLQYMKYNVDTLKNKIDYENADNYPTIGAYFEYGYNNDKLEFNNEQDYYLGVIGISYTLFDADITNIKRQKAKIEYKKNSFLLEHMKSGIQLEVKNNLLEFNAKEKILNQKIKAENFAEDILNKSTQMYQNQLMSMNDLLMQQANEQKARAETIFARYEKNFSAAKLKLSIGESLKKDNK